MRVGVRHRERLTSKPVCTWMPLAREIILVRQCDDGLGLLHVMHQESSNRDLPLELPRVTDQLLPTMVGIILSLSLSISHSLSLFHCSLALSVALSRSVWNERRNCVRTLDYIGL